MIERKHLEILQAIQQNGSLSSAADKLCLSQSALSHAIKKLERQLNLELWHKDGRQIQLSKAGRYLLEQGDGLLSRFHSIEKTLHAYSQGKQGSLRIGMECHPCYQWLLRIVQPYLHDWPAVDLDVRQRFQFSGLEALLAYDIDALITPDPIHHPRLIFQSVFDYELKLVLAPQHRLANRPFIEPQDLTREHLITYPVNKERLDIYTQFLIPSACQVASEQQTETTEIMLHLVAAGRGVSAMPGWLIEQYQASLKLRSVRLGQHGIHKQIFIGVRKEEQAIDYLAAFIALCQQSSGF